MDKDNANPTVLNLSQLPKRQARKKAVLTGPGAKYHDIIFSKPAYLSSSDDESDWGADDADADGDFAVEPIDEQEVYDLIATISDPEHPLSLGQLAVVNLPDIHLRPYPPGGPDSLVEVVVEITPTISHCSLATIIGLAVRVRLEQAMPPNYRVEVRIKQGSHAQDDQVNKQLADKERVAAALENQDLKRMLDSMLSTCA
ncbi:hypothetical protein VUR80DRAFT_9922 [Thermomyces stellatus]